MKILICDDQAITREGLKMLLELEKDITIVGLAENGEQAVKLSRQHKPNLILMDLKMPLLNGVEATKQILKEFPSVKILVLTTYDDEEWIFDAIRAGASGYLLKDTPPQELIRAIRETLENKNFVDPVITGKLLKAISSGQSTLSLPADLNERELEILGFLANGLSNASIAEKMFLSEGTIRNYISSLLSKLNVKDRTQAAILARKMGLGN